MGELDIAIIGMDCKFPSISSIDEYWKILKFGKDVGQKAKLRPRHTCTNPYVDRAFYMDDIDKFDAKFFNISKKEAKYMDPQHRIFLESVWRALEDAGYIPNEVNEMVSLFAGAGPPGYLLNNIMPSIINEPNEYQSHLISILHGNSADYLCNQIAYKLNFQGPVYSIQSACSSSLASVYQACRNLQLYESDVAVAGGISINPRQGEGYYYQRGEIFSEDGFCRPFAKNATGTVFSSGAGAVVLKRLNDAIENKDYIYAIVEGVALNNDGNSKVGFMAPSMQGQSTVIQEALEIANINIGDIQYIEAHGTGTQLGDTIEIEALKNVFQDKNFHYFLGSVKGNIGHTNAASGIAGLIKTVLCINKKLFCPSLHAEEENENLHGSVFEIIKEVKEWPLRNGKRRAGVSSFGMGGTNVHLVLKNYDEQEEKPERKKIVFNKESYWINELNSNDPLIANNDNMNSQDTTYEISDLITNLWKKYLEIDEVNHEDNLFNIGGHSLVGIQIVAEIDEIYNITLPIDEILIDPTLQNMISLTEKECEYHE